MRIPLLSAFLLSALFVAGQPVTADEPLHLTIKDHKFTPDHLPVPAGQKFLLIVTNADPTGEEFESHSLHREKLVGAGASIKVHLGPLKPGTYHFFGDFHEDTAQGVLIAQ